jgi:aspartate aminotransferase
VGWHRISELPRGNPVAVMTSSQIQFSDRADGLAPSATLAMVQRVRDLQAQGIEILGLTAGEPDFSPPKVAEQAGIEAIQQGMGRYTAAAGTLELREAIVEHIRTDIGLEYDPSEIVVTNGAKIGICQALLALVQRGDEVLIPYPCWTSYPEMVGLAEATPVMVACNEQQYPDLDLLEAKRTDRTRAIMLNTPSNPTGAVYPESVLRELGQWAVQHGISILSDEIYASLTYGGVEHISPLKVVPELRGSSVWIGGMSKAYAMTGWRMGFVAADRPLAQKIGALQSQLAGSPGAISQIASVAALKYGTDARSRMHAAFEKRRLMVVAALQKIPNLPCALPNGAFYAFPALDEYLGRTDPTTGRVVNSGDDFIELLLEADRVACIGGSAFGAPNSFRLSFATSDEVLEEALRRIAGRLAQLR